MATANLASDFTAGVYTSSGVLASNNYAVIPVTWSGLDGYPEILVEQAVEDVDASYHPVRVADEFGITRPVKLRLIDTSSLANQGEIISIDSLYADTPYVRIRIFANAATVGTITWEINVG